MKHWTRGWIKLCCAPAFYLIIVDPLLIAAHPVAPDQIDRSERVRRIETVVVRHDLVTLRVRKHLVAAQPVTVAAANLFVRLAAHRVETVVRFHVANLRRSAVENEN